MNYYLTTSNQRKVNTAKKERLEGDRFVLEEIEQIKQLQPESKKRQKLLERLIKRTQPQFIRKSQAIFSGKDKCIREDARQQTRLNTIKYIDKYNPAKKKFVNWQALIFKRELYKLVKKQKKVGMTNVPNNLNNLKFVSIDASNYYLESSQTNTVYNNSFNELVKQNPQQLLQIIKHFVWEDPEGLFKSIPVKTRSINSISLRDVLLEKLEFKTYKEICQLYKIKSESTVDSTIKRHLKDPKFRKYITKYTGIEFD